MRCSPGRAVFLFVLLAPGLLCFPTRPALALSTRTLIAPTGAAAGDFFGWSAANAGDVNGDGYADVIVGAHHNDAGGADAGRAYVYFGGPNADAIADLTLTGASAGDDFGLSVSGAGDVNGDGYADVIVGAPLADPGGIATGRAYVYFGGPGADATADWVLTGEADGDIFGYSVSAAGDVNGDGYADVIVGAPFNDAGGVSIGRAYVYYGGPGADAIPDLTLTGEFNADFFGGAVAAAGDWNADGYGDVVVGASDNGNGGPKSGSVYIYFGGPTADAVADVALTGSADERLGTSVAGAGDVNGDGRSDLIAGAPNLSAIEGKAFVYFGGPGADAVADLTLSGNEVQENFGTSVSGAGDVNGDGYVDVIVGAPNNNAAGTSAGLAYVFCGGPAADGSPDLLLGPAVAGDVLGFSVAGGGDVNGDGYADVIVGAYGNDAGGSSAGRAYVICPYPFRVVVPNGGEQWVTGQPYAVRWEGHDVADVAISLDGGLSWSALAANVGGATTNELQVVAPGVATSAARVRVSYAGQPATHATADASDAPFRVVEPTRAPAVARQLRLTPTGAAANDHLGTSLANAGDVNGDGYADWIVGAYGNDTGGTDAGRAYVYFGGPTADAVADWTLTGALAGDFFGASVAGAGDVNRDGYADVIVGAFGNDAGGSSAGRAYVYFGGPSPDAVADWTLTGAAAGDQFGLSVAGAGDVNGDGYADVIVGAYGNDAGGSSAGRAYVYFGAASPDPVADWTLTGAAAGDQLGLSVAGAGDVNGDGYADVIVGAFGNDVGGLDAGRAYVHYGGRTPDAVADLTLTGAAAGDNFGQSVAGAGDVNGDGYADVIVGANFNDAGAPDGGRAYVFFGGPDADATADMTPTGRSSGALLGASVAGAGDVNDDGFADVIVGALSAAYVYLGGTSPDEEADLALAGLEAGENFGVCVSGGGRMTAQGFGRVLVGANSNSVGGVGAGRGYLFDVNRYFVLSPNDDELWNVGASNTVSWLGAERADLWLSADGGNTYELLRHDVGGEASNLLTLLAPHTPTKFARVKVTPADPSITGADESDSLFTIQSSVALLSLVATLGEGGAELTWSSEPAVGPQGLAGYRVYRISDGGSGNGVRIGPDLITETRYTDAAGSAGTTYRLTSVNGLREELELGRVSLALQSPLAAWPLPYRGGAMSVSFGVSGSFGSTSGEATVELFDLGGRKVRTLASGRYTSGFHAVRWDGLDDRGEVVRNGIYFLRATSARESRQLKVAVVR